MGQAEGAADVDPAIALAELEQAHDTLGSSMQRDIAAGREPELDAIPGSVLRAAARHGLQCPTIERLVAMIAARAEVPVRSSHTLSNASSAAPALGLFLERDLAWRVPGAPAGTACVATASTASSSASTCALVVLAVAQHAKVPGDAAVGVDGDARAGSPRPPRARAARGRSGRGRCRRRCASGSRGRARPPPGRSARGSWRSSRSSAISEGRVARRVIHWEAMAGAHPVGAPAIDPAPTDGATAGTAARSSARQS